MKGPEESAGVAMRLVGTEIRGDAVTHARSSLAELWLPLICSGERISLKEWQVSDRLVMRGNRRRHDRLCDQLSPTMACGFGNEPV